MSRAVRGDVVAIALVALGPHARAQSIESAEDYFCAAKLYQHSASPDDHLVAHVLATIAGYKGHMRARWLSAAALCICRRLGRPRSSARSTSGTVNGRHSIRHS